jgi:hypothetical protein
MVAEPTEEEQSAKAKAEIAARLGRAGFALPGTLLERTMRCGKPNCACKADPPRLHGPYHHSTFAVLRSLAYP